MTDAMYAAIYGMVPVVADLIEAVNDGATPAEFQRIRQRQHDAIVRLMAEAEAESKARMGEPT